MVNSHNNRYLALSPQCFTDIDEKQTSDPHHDVSGGH